MSQSEPTYTITLDSDQLAAVHRCFSSEIIRLQYVGNRQTQDWITNTHRDIGKQIADQRRLLKATTQPQTETPGEVS